MTTQTCSKCGTTNSLDFYSEFDRECKNCKHIAMVQYEAERKAAKTIESQAHCDDCGTAQNLTTHFGMNEQTGKYSKHLCTACNAKAEGSQSAANAKRNAIVERNIYIAKTDN